MQFDIKEWRKIYDEVKVLAKQLREGSSDSEGNPAINALPLEERNELVLEIKRLTDKSNYYMDACGLRCPAPLWVYNLKYPKTWRSHETFAYQHLMKF